MISVIMTMRNRAHLLRWCLEAIHRNTAPLNKEDIEINILGARSTDGLDDLLIEESKRFGKINKYTWDRSKLAVPIAFNCPAQAYNLLVRLANYDIIYKTDPEMVILDKDFVAKAVGNLEENASAIVMPYPYHCYDFHVNNFEDIEKNYLQNYYPTHITKENAKQRMIYYQAIYKKKAYVELGGIDERFSGFIGSEDDHHLGWWRRSYGDDSFIPLVNSPCVHLYHGGMAQAPKDGQPCGVPAHLYPWVNAGSRLRENLKDIRPNQSLEWGRVPENLGVAVYVGGRIVFEGLYYGNSSIVDTLL
jgi:hypothetical protein